MFNFQRTTCHTIPSNWLTMLPAADGAYPVLIREYGQEGLIVDMAAYDSDGWVYGPECTSVDVVAYLPLNFGIEQLKSVRKHFKGE